MRLNEVNETKKIWLKWIIDFCNTDLQEIKGEKKFYLVQILEKLFYPFHSPEDVWKSLFEVRGADQFSFQVPDRIWGKVSSIQEHFKIFFFQIINEREGMMVFKRRDKSEEPLRVKSLYQLASKFYPFLAVLADGSSQFGFMPPELVEDYMAGRLFKKNDKRDPTFLKAEHFSPEAFEKGKLSLVSKTYYLAWLYSVLDGIPLQWIQKCKGCDRFFLNPTDREKIYCNSSCASRSIAKKKREELKKNPRKYKAYLKKQRKYMKKRYIKMRQSQFGPNVVVGRKIRKRKDG